jgi:hypothetical protein
MGPVLLKPARAAMGFITNHRGFVADFGHGNLEKGAAVALPSESTAAKSMRMIRYPMDVLRPERRFTLPHPRTTKE